MLMFKTMLTRDLQGRYYTPKSTGNISSNPGGDQSNTPMIIKGVDSGYGDDVDGMANKAKLTYTYSWQYSGEQGLMTSTPMGTRGNVSLAKRWQTVFCYKSAHYPGNASGMVSVIPSTGINTYPQGIASFEAGSGTDRRLSITKIGDGPVQDYWKIMSSQDIVNDQWSYRTLFSTGGSYLRAKLFTSTFYSGSESGGVAWGQSLHFTYGYGKLLAGLRGLGAYFCRILIFSRDLTDLELRSYRHNSHIG